MHRHGKARIVTVVERKSGLIRIGKLPRATVAHTSQRTIEIMRGESHPIRSITADNGAEFHGYKAIDHALAADVYFATPHHAWERGTNENTNGLVRQYLPKGINLQQLTQPQCDQIAAKLNRRPRLRHDFRTPNEVYYDIPSSRRRWAASCGKLFGSCPRKRPIGCPKGPMTILRHPRPDRVALQT